MIDMMRSQWSDAMTQERKVHVTREFLQILCLKIMSDKRMFDAAAFLGGTALRVLFDLRRFSEDLDFSVTDAAGCDTQVWLGQFVKSFELFGIPVETKKRFKGPVHSIMFKFPGLLKELGLSGLADQKLSVKWDVDTNPPAGAEILRTVVNKVYLFDIAHYDVPSLFAGKLHACFFRAYTKGRDWYDFVWHLSKKNLPNFTLLNNAIRQTHGESPRVDRGTFKDFLLEHVRKIDFEAARRDVERFLEDPNELTVLDKQTIVDTIERIY